MSSLYSFYCWYENGCERYCISKYIDTEPYQYYGNGKDNSNKTLFISMKEIIENETYNIIIDYFVDIFIEYLNKFSDIKKSDENKKVIKEILIKNIKGFDVDKIFLRSFYKDKNIISYRGYDYIRIQFNNDSVANKKGIGAFMNYLIGMF